MYFWRVRARNASGAGAWSPIRTFTSLVLLPEPDTAGWIRLFRGDNEGLVIAEIELRDHREGFDRPPWLGVEVTGQPQYYNSSLARQPYCRWFVPLRSSANAD